MEQWEKMFILNLVHLCIWYLMGSFMWLSFNVATWNLVGCRITFVICFTISLNVYNIISYKIIKQWSE